jgi:hypothetical protein
MKRVLLALAVMGLVAGGAQAQLQTDLSGGVIMCHHPAGLSYTFDAPPEGWCAFNDLQGCPENNDELANEDPFGMLVWYVCAAFVEDSEWCGVEFGLEYGGPYDFVLLDHGVCTPGGFLTIESEDPVWPLPGSGIAITTTTVPWTGNFEEVYWFGGYVYAGGVWCTVENIHTTPVIAFSNCAQVEYPAECYGCIGFGPGNFGFDCCPTIPEPDGACCVGEVCTIETEADCIGLGGTYLGDGTDCGPPNPCDLPDPGACCIDHVCHFVLADECALMGGVFMGEGVPCTPDNPCEIFTPADPTSWGAIKDMYR